jgi:hypothetical protein
VVAHRGSTRRTRPRRSSADQMQPQSRMRTKPGPLVEE